MKGKIECDDIRPGVYVIVSEWFDEAEQSDDYHWCSPPPKKPVGIPFRILAIALPFVTVQFLETCASGKRGVLDTREVSLIEVDLDYVRSLIPDFKPTSRKTPAVLSKDERVTVKRYFMKGGVWRNILEEPRS